MDCLSVSSDSLKISSHAIEMIIDRLQSQQTRQSTTHTYLAIWRQFNKFLLSLDKMPKNWEARTVLFIGYLIEKGMQSTTVKSYVSAIKRTLLNDKYKWQDEAVQMNLLTQACKLKNDVVHIRLQIHCSLLELILFEVKRIYKDQVYLQSLYLALYALGYYGLMRVGELTMSKHVIKVANVHLATNKDKLLLVLYSSKTHSEADRPQKIKIISNRLERTGKYLQRNFCPFQLIRSFLKRGRYKSDTEPLFVFRDKSYVTAEQARKLLRKCITNIGLNASVYDMHSLRIGRTSDLIKFHYSIEEVKRLGRWRSNVVYKYIRM